MQKNFSTLIFREEKTFERNFAMFTWLDKMDKKNGSNKSLKEK